MSLIPDLTQEEMAQVAKPEWLQPEADPLTKEEVKAARKDGKVLSYPAVVRGHVTDPIPGQSIALVSFIFFKDDEVKNGMHGLVRVDSVHPSEQQSEMRTNKILETMDSRHTIHQANVGIWHPITNNAAFSREEVDLDLKKRVEKEHANMSEDIFFQEREKKAKDARIDEKRKEDLEKESQQPYSEVEESLHEFITKQNLLLNLENYILDGYKKIEDLKKKVENTQKIVDAAKEKHPEYTFLGENGNPEWVTKYNNVRQEVGLPNVTEKEFWGDHAEKYYTPSHFEKVACGSVRKIVEEEDEFADLPDLEECSI